MLVQLNITIQRYFSNPRDSDHREVVVLLLLVGVVVLLLPVVVVVLRLLVVVVVLRLLVVVVVLLLLVVVVVLLLLTWLPTCECCAREFQCSAV